MKPLAQERIYWKSVRALSWRQYRVRKGHASRRIFESQTDVSLTHVGVHTILFDSTASVLDGKLTPSKS
jgi:hypothetical protein